jgi:adenylate kinase family enzyme
MLHPAARIVIAGAPRAGKTTLGEQLARETGFRLRHTDDLVGRLDWSAASAEVSTWLDAPGPWIVEGVTAVRALRKWLSGHAAHAHGAPADVIHWLTTARVPRTPPQEAMAKGCATVWAEILPLLRGRGVTVVAPP